jgi:hypothetical protein
MEGQLYYSSPIVYAVVDDVTLALQEEIADDAPH